MRIALLVIVLHLFDNTLLAQLSIEPGTKWVSDDKTFVSLDDIGLRYDSYQSKLGNTFQFTGSGAVNIKSNDNLKFNRLVVDKSTSQLSLKSDIYVLHAVNFKSGLFNLNNHLLTLDPAALILNENEESHFIDTGNGRIIIAVNLVSPSSVNAGNLGAGISAPAYTGAATITRGHQRQFINSTTYNSIARYYTIDLDDRSEINMTLRLSYFDAEKNGLDENTFELWKTTDGTVWKPLGESSRNTTLNYVELANVKSLGMFTISQDEASMVTGVESPDLSQFVVSVYPTIATGDKVYIETGKANVDRMDVLIVDINGRQLFNQSLPYQSQWIALPEGSAGMNIIRIQSGKWRYRCVFRR